MKNRNAVSPLCGAIAMVLAGASMIFPALAQERTFDLPASNIASALPEFGRQAGVQIVAPADGLTTAKTPVLKGRMDVREALARLLAGSDLMVAGDNGSTITLRLAGISLASLGTTGMPLPLSADASSLKQDAATPRTQPGANDPRALLDSLVVTAQKREQSALEVPISLVALGAEDLDSLGVRDIDDLARLVPGLNNLATSSYGGSTLSIRGINANTGSSTTGVYINDTPVQTRNYLGVVNNGYPKLFDLERVEVLKGPQGTLFGSSSEGGAIRFITPTPSVTDTSTYVRADLATTAGGDPSAELGVAYGAPIVEDSVGARVSIWKRHVGGYLDRVDREEGNATDRDTNSGDDLVAQAALVLIPNEHLTITPSVFYQKVERDDIDVYWPGAGKERSWYGIAQPETDRFVLPSLSVDYRFDGFALKSVTSYFDRRDNRVEDYAPLSVAALTGGAQAYVPDVDFHELSTTVTRQRNWSQEFRLTSDDPEARFSWVAGAFLQFETQDYDQDEVDNIGDLIPVLFPDWTLESFYGRGQLPGNISFLQDLRFKQSEKALFGEMTYRFTPELKASLGVRASHASFSYHDVQDGPFVGPEQLRYSGRQSEDPVTPKLNVSHETPGQLLYASIAKGYRIGGANSQVPVTCADDLAELGMADVPGSYGSDKVWSYEAGIKRRLMGNRMEVSGAVFQVDWSDIQVNIPLSNCGFGFNANLGKAVSRGVDFQLRASPVSGLLLNLALAYTDTEYTHTVTGGGTPPVVLAKDGDDLNVPPFQGSASVDYSWMLASGRYAYVHADYQYADNYHRTNSLGVNGYNPWTRDAGSIGLAGLRLGFRQGDVDWSLYVDNLLDNDALTYYYRAEAASAADARAVRLRPRTIGISFILRR